jgi:hypothetical protein
MNTQEATIQDTDSRGQQATEQRGDRLQVGSLVCVTSYGPFRGLRGIIRTVDTISADLQDPFCFYLVTLVGAHIKEPIWFEYHEVEGVTSA